MKISIRRLPALCTREEMVYLVENGVRALLNGTIEPVDIHFPTDDPPGHVSIHGLYVDVEVGGMQVRKLDVAYIVDEACIAILTRADRLSVYPGLALEHLVEKHTNSFGRDYWTAPL